MFSNFNTITIAILIVILIPLIGGLFRGITAKGMVESVLSLMKTLELVFFLVASVSITKNIFFKEESLPYNLINHLIPQNLKDAVQGQDMIAYLIVTPIIMFIFVLIDLLLLAPVYIKIFTNIAKKLQLVIGKIPGFFRHILGMIWSVPKAIAFAVILGLGLNLFAYFTPDSDFNSVLNSSKAYDKIHEYAIKPMLHANIAKDIPLILSNTFAFDERIPEPTNGANNGETVYPSNVRVIHYFNGVTLDEAVKSDEKIDSFARDQTKGKITSRDKSKALYKWISSNIKYDDVKAKNISTNSKDYNSGAKVAFYTRKGICFDYAALYVAMCRANNIKVAIVTGLGYNGINWGDHAWNRSFCSEENNWINVDPTFGSVSNYFDKKDFYSDHRYEKIREEW